jgi:hypothetical protein
VNIEHLRKSLRAQWLTYYRDNRSWLTHLGVWVTCEGERRPSSSFILGTLSTLEPQLIQLLPLIVDLSSNPDRIVIALGLNFNPDDELKSFEETEQLIANGHNSSVRMLPEGHTVEGAVQRVTESELEPEANPFEALDPIAHSSQTESSQTESSQTEPSRTAQTQTDTAEAAEVQKEAESAKPSPPVRKPTRSQSTVPQSRPAPSAAKPTTTPPIAPAAKAPLVNPNPQQETHPDASLTDRPVQAVTSSPPVFEQRFAVVRPVMDSVELSAGELPKREVESDNTNLDERTRHSDR